MAIVSVVDRLMAVLPARLAAALGLQESAIYVGRWREEPRRDVEVFVRPSELEENPRTLTVRTSHHFELAVCLRLPDDAAATGTQQTQVHARMLAAIRDDLGGDQGLPWREEMPDLVAIACRELVRDAQTQETDAVVGLLRLSLFFQGSGTVLAQPAFGGAP